METEEIIDKIEPINYKKDLVLALEAAEKAYETMEEALDTGIENVESKGLAEIVTETDKKCQEKIVETIKDERSEDGFLAEEDNLQKTDRERVWVIDPIDGTYNFSKGFPFFCCSIALRVEKETEVAVVKMPESSLDKTFIAVRDHGSYEIDGEVTELEVAGNENFRESAIQVSLAERYPSMRPSNLELVERLLDEKATIRRAGAAAIDICMVAKGSLDATFHRCHDWDYAAAGLILEEAGGKLWTNRRNRDRLTECIAGNKEMMEELKEEYEQVKLDTGVIFKGED